MLYSLNLDRIHHHHLSPCSWAVLAFLHAIMAVKRWCFCDPPGSVNASGNVPALFRTCLPLVPQNPLLHSLDPRSRRGCHLSIKASVMLREREGAGDGLVHSRASC